MKKLTTLTTIAASVLLLAACGNNSSAKDSSSAKDKSASVSKAKAKASSKAEAASVSKAKASSESAAKAMSASKAKASSEASSKAQADSESQSAASSQAAASSAKSSSQSAASTSNATTAPVPAGKTLVKLTDNEQAYALETLEQADVGLDMGYTGDTGSQSGWGTTKGLLPDGGFGWMNYAGAKGINVYHVYKYSDGTGLVELYAGSVQDSSPYNTWPKTSITLPWAKYAYN